MKIIINADDFGIDIDRDFGILYGVLRGYISSVSVIVTGKIGILRKSMIKLMRKKASVGIHINLTDDPLLNYEMKDLCIVDYNYNKAKHSFWKNAIFDTVDIEKIQKEIQSQIDKFKLSFDFFPEHIDGHNHCNIFNRRISRIFEEIALKNKIHLRIPYEDLELFDKTIIESNTYFEEYNKYNKINEELIKRKFDYFIKYDMYLNNYMCKKNCRKDTIIFIGTMYGYFRETEILYNQLTKFKRDDIIQVMTHPGFYWKFIKHKTKFSSYDRLKELKALKKLRKKIEKETIEYVTYKEEGDYIGK